MSQLPTSGMRTRLAIMPSGWIRVCWCIHVAARFWTLVWFTIVQPGYKPVGSFKMGQVWVKSESRSTTRDVQSEIRPEHALDSPVSSQSLPQQQHASRDKLLGTEAWEQG